MCHWRELSWVESTDELKKFKKGQTITVKIIEVIKDERFDSVCGLVKKIRLTGLKIIRKR